MKVLILRTDGTNETIDYELDKDDQYGSLIALAEKAGITGWLECINVIVNGSSCSMYVDEEGSIKHLGINNQATEIYGGILRKGNYPEDELPYYGIVGNAFILFDNINQQ